MGRQKGGGKNGPKERQRRRQQKSISKERQQLKREARMSSVIVGPDGKTPVQSEVEPIEYRAGGLLFKTPMTPGDVLTQAVQSAQHMIGAQVYDQVFKETRSALAAQTKAQVAASEVGDPFTLEPAAMAVFMYLSREIEFRDALLEQLNDRLVELGVEPLDLTHPYPLPPEPEPDDGDGEQEGSPDGEQADEGDDEESSLIITS